MQEIKKNIDKKSLKNSSVKYDKCITFYGAKNFDFFRNKYKWDLGKKSHKMTSR